MEIVIKIDEEEVQEMATKIIAEKIVREIDSGHGMGYTYRRDVKAIIREILRDNIDDLSNRAISAAAKSIENRAVKKLIDQLQESET